MATKYNTYSKKESTEFFWTYNEEEGIGNT